MTLLVVQKFHIEGLAHEDERLVEETLASLKGVIYTSANHQDACAEVEFEDDTVTTESMRSALEAIGYRARMAG